MKQLDELYSVVDALCQEKCWTFLDDILKTKTPQVWRMGVNIALGWATATLPCKSKLPARAEFMNECYRRYPEKELWKGLEQ